MRPGSRREPGRASRDPSRSSDSLIRVALPSQSSESICRGADQRRSESPIQTDYPSRSVEPDMRPLAARRDPPSRRAARVSVRRMFNFLMLYLVQSLKFSQSTRRAARPAAPPARRTPIRRHVGWPAGGGNGPRSESLVGSNPTAGGGRRWPAGGESRPLSAGGARGDRGRRPVAGRSPRRLGSRTTRIAVMVIRLGSWLSDSDRGCPTRIAVIRLGSQLSVSDRSHPSRIAVI